MAILGMCLCACVYLFTGDLAVVCEDDVIVTTAPDSTQKESSGSRPVYVSSSSLSLSLSLKSKSRNGIKQDTKRFVITT